MKNKTQKVFSITFPIILKGTHWEIKSVQWKQRNNFIKTNLYNLHCIWFMGKLHAAFIFNNDNVASKQLHTVRTLVTICSNAAIVLGICLWVGVPDGVDNCLCVTHFYPGIELWGTTPWVLRLVTDDNMDFVQGWEFNFTTYPVLLLLLVVLVVNQNI